MDRRDWKVIQGEFGFGRFYIIDDIIFETKFFNNSSNLKLFEFIFALESKTKAQTSHDVYCEGNIWVILCVIVVLVDFNAEIVEGMLLSVRNIGFIDESKVQVSLPSNS